MEWAVVSEFVSAHWACFNKKQMSTKEKKRTFLGSGVFFCVVYD